MLCAAMAGSMPRVQRMVGVQLQTSLERVGQEAEEQMADDGGYCFSRLGCTRAGGWLWLGSMLCQLCWKMEFQKV